MSLGDIALPLLFTFLAGASTVFGGLIVLAVRSPSNTFLAFTLGASAGVMLMVSFVELLGRAIEDVGFVPANIAFFAGIAVIFAIDLLVPHHFMEDRNVEPNENSRLLRTGTLVALGIAVHNFPEGMVVFFASLESLRLGGVLAIAIAIHNIPEGIAVAMPIYHATGNRTRAVLYAGLSGMAEPLGALIAALFLLPLLTEEAMGYVLAFVGGIMVFISLDELLPAAHRYGEEHWVILGILLGMLVMAVSLALLV
jgi:zinc transporter, ZIP family